MVDIKGKLYAVGSDGNVGLWEEPGWKDMNKLGGWGLERIALDHHGETWCVGTDGNIGTWDWDAKKMEDWKKIGGWALRDIAFDSGGQMWGVGTNYNLGKWKHSNWEDLKYRGGWSLRSIAFDNEDTMWCVGTNGNVGRWSKSADKWDDHGNLDNWGILSIAFDAGGGLWCVGTNGNVGLWNRTDEKWDYEGYLGQWGLRSLTFVNEALTPTIIRKKGKWHDIPLDEVTAIQFAQSGSVKVTLGTTVETRFMTQKEHSKTEGSSKTEGFEVAYKKKFPESGQELSGKFKFSATQSKKVTDAVTKQTAEALTESKQWEQEIPCPPTKEGYVRIALTEAILRENVHPMQITVGTEVFYAQEYINYSRVSYGREYEIGSEELRAQWKEYTKKYPDLTRSHVQADQYLKPGPAASSPQALDAD